MTSFSGVGNGEVCSAESDLLPKGPVLQDAARVTRDKCLHPPTQPECGAFARNRGHRREEQESSRCRTPWVLEDRCGRARCPNLWCDP